MMKEKLALRSAISSAIKSRGKAFLPLAYCLLPTILPIGMAPAMVTKAAKRKDEALNESERGGRTTYLERLRKLRTLTTIFPLSRPEK